MACPLDLDQFYSRPHLFLQKATVLGNRKPVLQTLDDEEPGLPCSPPAFDASGFRRSDLH